MAVTTIVNASPVSATGPSHDTTVVNLFALALAEDEFGTHLIFDNIAEDATNTARTANVGE